MLEELKEMFFALCQKKQNLSEQELLEFKQIPDFQMPSIEEALALAARNDLLPMLEYFTKNEGNLHIILDHDNEKLSLLNIAAEEGSLDVLNYLLDNEVEQESPKCTQTAFHSAIEGNQIEAAKLLLKRGADINAIYLRHEKGYSALDKLFGIYMDENDVEFDYLEMAKFLVKCSVQIPNEVNTLYSDSFIQNQPNKGPIKNLLISIKELEGLNIVDHKSDFNDAYNALDSEIQEIWDVRVSKNLARFISEKFSENANIEYKDYAALRKYNSLSEAKKEILEIFLEQNNYTSNDLVKIDNYIKNHFFEIAKVAKSLECSDLALLGSDIIPQITQYLKFDDIKIAGADSE